MPRQHRRSWRARRAIRRRLVEVIPVGTCARRRVRADHDCLAFSAQGAGSSTRCTVWHVEAGRPVYGKLSVVRERHLAVTREHVEAFVRRRRPMVLSLDQLLPVHPASNAMEPRRSRPLLLLWRTSLIAPGHFPLSVSIFASSDRGPHPPDRMRATNQKVGQSSSRDVGARYRDLSPYEDDVDPSALRFDVLGPVC